MNRISFLASTLTCLAFSMVSAPSTATEAVPTPPTSATATKDASVGSRLLLPGYRVEAGNVFGASTLYAVRNDSLAEVDVLVRYYEIDAPQAPQRTDVVTIGPKGVYTVNLRDVANLEVDGDGFARGYVTFDAAASEPVLWGDFFQITPDEAFATGERLVNRDRDLCSVFSIRFLSGGAFSGGTELLLWVETDSLPLPVDAATFAIYSEAGGTPLSFDFLPLETAVVRVPVEDLQNATSDVAAGVVEIQLGQGLQGHLSGTLSANGLYSVGLEAACRD